MILFRWLSDWLARRNRGLFTIFDGVRHRQVDPYLVWVKLKSDPEMDLEVHPPLADKGDEESIMVVARAVNRAFGVKALDEGGISTAESFQLFFRFMLYMHALKKNFAPMLTSSPTSDGKPSTEESPMSGDSESSSTQVVLEFGEDTEP